MASPHQSDQKKRGILHIEFSSEQAFWVALTESV